MKTLVLLLTAFAALSLHAKDLNSETDAALVAAAEQLVQEDAKVKPASEKIETAAAKTEEKVEAKPAQEQLATDMKDEAKIPVFTKSAKVQKSEGSLLWRLIMSLALIGVVGTALIFAGRKYTSQKNKGGDKARIEVLHQYALGPKRSVVLIRVAGECLLLGCTDHSVNMLKSIALIDDELENTLGAKDFNGFLEDEFSMEDVKNALSARA